MRSLGRGELLFVISGVVTFIAAVLVAVLHDHAASDVEAYLVGQLVNAILAFLWSGGILMFLLKGLIAAVVMLVILATIGQLVVKFSPALLCIGAGMVLYFGTVSLGEPFALILGLAATMVLMANMVIFYRHT